MIINFKICKINRGIRKLTRKPPHINWVGPVTAVEG
jgi:hypothetical protein